MNRRLVTMLATLCGAAVMTAGTGCEDSEARARAEAQEQILGARAQFEKASLGSTEPGDEYAEQTRADLNRLLSNLQGVQDGAPGQQAAKSLLMADTLRELFAIEFRGIDRVERDLQLQRRTLDNRLLGLQRLAAVQRAREAVNAEQHRAELAEIRRATDEQLRQLQQHLAQINEPIDDLSERNERDMDRVDELREQAVELIRRAEELGPADGFETFEQGIKLHREADLIEFRTAHRELELTLEHQPQRETTERQLAAARDLKQQVERAIRDLESFDELYASAASQLRSRIDQGRDELREGVRRIAEVMTGELASAYDEAAEHLTRRRRRTRAAKNPTPPALSRPGPTSRSAGSIGSRPPASART